MDTRNKILSPEAAPRACTVVTGAFDVVLAADARELAEIRASHPDRPLLVVVLPLPDELLPQAEAATPAAPATIMRDQIRARLSTVDSKQFDRQSLPVCNTAGYGTRGFAIYLRVRHLMSLYMKLTVLWQ